MATHGKKFLLWATMLVTITACVLPSVGAPVVPTIDPGAVNTYIAQTANAAATQTVAALPTNTPTATFTPTPLDTDTPTPTPTNTVVFLLKSPTPIIPPTIPGSGSSRGYDCEVLSVYPFAVTFSSRTNFEATWTIKNTGTKKWDRNSVDFVYSSGDKIHKVSGYDLTKDVNPGQNITLSVSMQAPKTAGNYTTYWALRDGGTNICRMVATLVVN